jgi:hypothetical protein
VVHQRDTRRKLPTREGAHRCGFVDKQYRRVVIALLIVVVVTAALIAIFGPPPAQDGV